MIITKTVDLKKEIARIVNDDKKDLSDCEITFSRGIEFPKYRITIEEINEDFFIDSKGVKWVKST